MYARIRTYVYGVLTCVDRAAQHSKAPTASEISNKCSYHAHPHPQDMENFFVSSSLATRVTLFREWEAALITKQLGDEQHSSWERQVTWTPCWSVAPNLTCRRASMSSTDTLGCILAESAIPPATLLAGRGRLLMRSHDVRQRRNFMTHLFDTFQRQRACCGIAVADARGD